MAIFGFRVVDGPNDVGGVCRVGQVTFENDLGHPKMPKITFLLCYTGAKHKIQPGKKLIFLSNV